MAKSTSMHKRFLRAALKRLQEAEFLLDAGFHTAAVYLAGYAVECVLKALVLSSEPVAWQKATLKTFRGAKAHEFMWLLHELRERKNEPSDPIKQALNEVNWWSTEIRYDPSDMKRQLAEEFLAISEKILVWARGRMP